MKKPVTKIRTEVATLAKLVAKSRDNYICQHCGKKVKGSDAHGSHIEPESHGNALRFDPNNIICLCYHCHMNWWHKSPLEASKWIKKKFPLKVKYVEENRNKIVKYTYEDYEEMKTNLKDLLQTYNKMRTM